MPVVLACGACQGRMQLPDHFTAEAVRCPSCGRVVRVRPAPAPSPAPPPPPAPAPAPAGQILTCPGCRMQMRVPAIAPGQAVKCPGCARVFTVAGAAPPPAPAWWSTAPPPAAPAPPANGNGAGPAPPPAAESISVTCQGCKKSIRVPAARAGKNIKCPGCGQVNAVPAGPAAAPAAPKPAAATWGPEWIEVNEAAAPAPAAKGASGEELLEGHDLPDNFKQDIRAALTRGERLVWCDRPQVPMMVDAARKFQLIAGSLLTLGLVIGLGVAVYFLIEQVWLGVIIPLVFCAFFAVADAYALLAPRLTLKNAPKRPCYLVTNRRLLVHSGSGTQFKFGTSGQAVDQVRAGITPFTGPELAGLRRDETPKYPGAGHLYLGRADKEGTGGGVSLDYLANVRDVERMIREKLIHPYIDKLLAPRPKSADKDPVLDDPNVKAAPGVRRPAGPGADDPNVKAAPGVRRGKGGKDPNVKDYAGEEEAPSDLRSAPKDARAEAESELTVGERILWMGAPDSAVVGRGLEGVDVEGRRAKRLETKCRFYALTNRRAMLFPAGAPISYYPPDLLKFQTEDDPRTPDGGSVIFRVYILTITTKDKNTGRELSSRSEVTFTGFLRIRNYRGVAGLLRRTLVAPLGQD
jgi:ribosomal protein S27E